MLQTIPLQDWTDNDQDIEWFDVTAEMHNRDINDEYPVDWSTNGYDDRYGRFHGDEYQFDNSSGRVVVYFRWIDPLNTVYGGVGGTDEWFGITTYSWWLHSPNVHQLCDAKHFRGMDTNIRRACSYYVTNATYNKIQRFGPFDQSKFNQGTDNKYVKFYFFTKSGAHGIGGAPGANDGQPPYPSPDLGIAGIDKGVTIAAIKLGVA